MKDKLASYSLGSEHEGVTAADTTESGAPMA